MAPKSNPPDRKNLIRPEQAIALLEEQKASGEALTFGSEKDNNLYFDWIHTTLTYIKKAFGDDADQVTHFDGYGPAISYPGQNRMLYLTECRDGHIVALDGLIKQLKTEIKLAAPSAVHDLSKEDFWSRLHPSVVRMSKARFESGHYADAVEAALKELNSRIKEHVRKATGKEFDGADLMNRAFSPNSPVIRVADLSTEDGKNMQQGYMQIFAGAMTGIRNPKAHSNVSIEETRAIHHLHLASLLHQIFDERL